MQNQVNLKHIWGVNRIDQVNLEHQNCKNLLSTGVAITARVLDLSVRANRDVRGSSSYGRAIASHAIGTGFDSQVLQSRSVFLCTLPFLTH